MDFRLELVLIPVSDVDRAFVYAKVRELSVQQAYWFGGC